MRQMLLTTVAVAALAMAGGAFAQENTHGGGKGDMGAAPTASHGAEVGKARMHEGRSAAGDADKADSKAPAAEKNGAPEGRGADKGRAEGHDQAKPDAGRASSARGEEKGGADKPGAEKGASARGENDKGDTSKSAGAPEHREPGKPAAASAGNGKPDTASSAKDKDEKGSAAERGHAGTERPAGAAASEDKGSKTGTAATEDKSGKAGSMSRTDTDKTTSGAASKTDRDQNRTGANETTRSGTSATGTAERGGASNTDARGSTSTSTTTSTSTETRATARGDVDIKPEQASRIHDRLVRESDARTDIDVTVDIGTALPERVHPRPVPREIVEIAPQFRDYDYVVVHDEIVIVQPKTRKVVEVIRQNGGSGEGRAAVSTSSSSRTRLTLSEQQERLIRDDIMKSRRAERQIEVREGVEVPDTILLEPLPTTIVTEVPAVREYRYFVDNDRIVIVDPGSREIVDVLE